MIKGILIKIPTVILVILSIFFLTTGLKEIQSAISIGKKNLSIPKQDIVLFRQIKMLKPLPLAYLQDNMKRLMLINELGLGNIQISRSNQVKSKEKSQETVEQNNEGVGMDKIGYYNDLTIKVDGDIFVQIYILKFMLKKYQSSMLIKSFKGNEKGLTIDVRGYGRV